MFLSATDPKASPREVERSIYDFTMNGIDGKRINFAGFKGKYLLLVNTASKCGYTPQYAELEKLHELYASKVIVLGFPANNFFWQEPGSNKEIDSFCKENYGIRFQMFEKISVKGKDRAPLYKWLEDKTGEKPTWNFCKYLVGPEGSVIGFFNSKVSPLDSKIVGLLK